MLLINILSNHIAYFLVHSRASSVYFFLSALNILAISGTSGSSGFGSHSKEQMESNTLEMVSAGDHCDLTWGYLDRCYHWSWCLGGRFWWWRPPWAVWMDSQLGSEWWGKRCPPGTRSLVDPLWSPANETSRLLLDRHCTELEGLSLDLEVPCWFFWVPFCCMKFDWEWGDLGTQERQWQWANPGRVTVFF